MTRPATRPPHRPELVIAAHGSRDPQAARTVAELRDLVAGLLPAVPVRVGWLSAGSPRLTGMELAGRVVVPLLLAAGYHARVDIPAAASPAGAWVTAPVGSHPGVVAALADRLEQAGAPAGAPVVLAAAGSSDPRARADVNRTARLLSIRRRAPVSVAYLAGGGPSVAAAVAARSGPVALASLLVAGGHFARKLASEGAAAGWRSEPIGAHPGLAAAIAARYLDGCRESRPDGSDELVPRDGFLPHVHSGVRGVDHHPAAHVDADVTRRAPRTVRPREEHEVARL
jgi:sirohydrochlorin ferrochelatase